MYACKRLLVFVFVFELRICVCAEFYRSASIHQTHFAHTHRYIRIALWQHVKSDINLHWNAGWKNVWLCACQWVGVAHYTTLFDILSLVLIFHFQEIPSRILVWHYHWFIQCAIEFTLSPDSHPSNTWKWLFLRLKIKPSVDSLNWLMRANGMKVFVCDVIHEYLFNVNRFQRTTSLFILTTIFENKWNCYSV